MAIAEPEHASSQGWFEWVKQRANPNGPMFKTLQEYGAVASGTGTAIGQMMGNSTGKAVGAAIEALPAVAGMYKEAYNGFTGAGPFNPVMLAGYTASAVAGGGMKAAGEYLGGNEETETLGNFLQGGGTFATMAGAGLGQWATNRAEKGKAPADDLEATADVELTASAPHPNQYPSRPASPEPELSTYNQPTFGSSSGFQAPYGSSSGVAPQGGWQSVDFGGHDHTQTQGSGSPVSPGGSPTHFAQSPTQMPADDSLLQDMSNLNISNPVDSSTAFSYGHAGPNRTSTTDAYMVTEQPKPHRKSTGQQKKQVHYAR
ncbi:hypothetical protein CLV70_10983 [Pseudosporangium ferrugineum]|uniref:Uncharacterized protein n=2 Tax=Pseudosporangium ferrugineum TaxID=439699 RepID=A0A2T0S3E1_9ACTN|nr:hypothetical protein CLV70_10983 [Pseudosporangium ferrugineum]